MEGTSRYWLPVGGGGVGEGEEFGGNQIVFKG